MIAIGVVSAVSSFLLAADRDRVSLSSSSSSSSPVDLVAGLPFYKQRGVQDGSVLGLARRRRTASALVLASVP